MEVTIAEMIMKCRFWITASITFVWYVKFKNTTLSSLLSGSMK